MDDANFRQQLKEDIKDIQENLSWDKNISKPEYAFNYWILSNIYSLDLEMCHSNITEHKDKGIDCFVHYEEDKELYIIQNKYYSETTPLSRQDFTDFITTSISILEKGTYKRSEELQKIYNKAKKDKEYKIFLHFYITNNHQNADVSTILEQAGADQCEVFYLSDIKDKYYGKSYKSDAKLNVELNTVNKGTTLAIRPKEYKLPKMSKAFYTMARITDIYQMYKQADEAKYPLFEDNIREYLGGTSQINKKIIGTLKDREERHKFFYYNNGITIICDTADEKADQETRIIRMENPQIVNGCQTVSSIAEALKQEHEDEDSSYKDVYVMVKILVIKKDDQDKEFYRDVVKYTNSQNSINEKIFGATRAPFFKMQEQLEEKGFLLLVKQSDKFQYKGKYTDQQKRGKLLLQANKASHSSLYEFKTISDVFMPLETLIQILCAYVKDAYFAYTKKSSFLKPTSKEYFQDFSIKMHEFFTIDQMVKLIILYKKAESDKRQSGNKRTPSPFYLLNFMGYYLDKEKINKGGFLTHIKIEDMLIVYDVFKPLSSKYMAKKGKDYNYIIKHPIDNEVMREVLDVHLEAIKEYTPEDHKRFTQIFDNIKSK